MARTLVLKKGGTRRRITAKKRMWKSGTKRSHWRFFDSLGEEILDLLYLDYLFDILDGAGDFDGEYEFDVETSGSDVANGLFEVVNPDLTEQILDSSERASDSPVFETSREETYTPPAREETHYTPEPEPESTRSWGGGGGFDSDSGGGGYDGGGGGGDD